MPIPYSSAHKSSPRKSCSESRGIRSKPYIAIQSNHQAQSHYRPIDRGGFITGFVTARKYGILRVPKISIEHRRIFSPSLAPPAPSALHRFPFSATVKLKSDMFAPAQNARPAPVRTMTRTFSIALRLFHRGAHFAFHDSSPGVEFVRDG